MIWLKTAEFFGSWLGRGVLIVSVIGSLWVWRLADKSALREEGRKEVKEATLNAINIGTEAAAKSGAPRTAGVRPVGKRDPVTRND